MSVSRWIATCLLLLGGVGCTTAGGPGPSSFGTKGTPWTIQCLERQGPERVRQVEQFAESLRRTPGIRSQDVMVFDESDGFARLYYGTYHRRMNPATRAHDTPKALQDDVTLIKQLGDVSGQRYFLQSMIVRLPTPDVGNPEWNLVGQPGRYTLQVALFEPAGDFWQFKQAAAEYCAELRNQGLEAYYYHSRASSAVTVGRFGPEAVIRRNEGGKFVTYYSQAVLDLQKNEWCRYNRLNGRIYSVRDPSGRSTKVLSRLVEIPADASAPIP